MFGAAQGQQPERHGQLVLEVPLNGVVHAQHLLAEEETGDRFVRQSRDALVERRRIGDSLLEVLLRITQLQKVTLAGGGSELEQLEQFSDQTLHRSVD